MTDAQRFIDSARHQLNDLAADVERHFDSVASKLQEFLSTDIPFAPVKPRRPPPPPPTTYEAAIRWMSKHRAITAAIIAFVLTGSVSSVLYVQSRKYSKKRRAARSASGARTEVVVIAGAIASPVASALAVDLERRGYIVYVVANGSEDEQYTRSLSRADLLPLPLTLTDPFAAQEQLARFQNLLGRQHVAFEGAEPHKLRLRGLVVVPDTSAVPNGVLEDISSEEWSDALNAKVLNTAATTQLFLPILKAHSAKFLLLTPSVSSSLLLPGHIVENTVCGALSAFTSTLSTELQSQGVAVTQFKLGSLDIPSVTAKQRREGAAAPRFKPTSLRKLHDGVFDALSARRPARTWHIGRGSLAYDIVGTLVPPSVVAWMMELSRRREKTSDPASQTALLEASEGSVSWEKVEGET